MTQTMMATGELRYGVDGDLEQKLLGPSGEVWRKVPRFASTAQDAAPCVGGGASGADLGHMEALRATLAEEPPAVQVGTESTGIVVDDPRVSVDLNPTITEETQRAFDAMRETFAGTGVMTVSDRMASDVFFDGESFNNVRGERDALRAKVAVSDAEIERLGNVIDNLRGASRDVPIRKMTDEEARRYVMLAQVNLAEALRHVAEAWLARGGSDDAVAVATRCRLNVAKASAYLDGENWVPPRDVKG